MTLIPDTPKTLDQLQTDAAARWQQISDDLTTKYLAQAAVLAKMPDVLARPDATQKWTPDPINIVCPCGGIDFFVTRWVTINGIKHRWEGTCASCNQLRTWDWLDMVWI
jgi:hypothetical protein